MFHDERMFKAFTNKAKSLIGVKDQKKPKARLLIDQFHELYPINLKNELMRLEFIQEDTLEHILKAIDTEVMSGIQKRWVFKLIMFRKAWLLTWIKGEKDYV